MAPLLLIVALFGCRENLYSSASPERAPIRWQARLGEIVTEDGLVDYDALEADRDALDGFVSWIARGDAFRGKKKADRHAFWLNAYNALAMFQVLERGRPASVLDVGGWVPVAGSGFFHETQFRVGPDHVSLSEILHERIRMRELNYVDHAGLNPGTRGGPPLRGELYEKPRLKEQLTDQVERWMRDPERGAAVVDGVAILPAEMGWYPFDFEFTTVGADPCSIAAWHVGGALAAQLEELAARGCPHRFREYDWSLNDANMPDAPTRP